MANEGRDRVTGGQGILEWDEGYVIRLLAILFLCNYITSNVTLY